MRLGRSVVELKIDPKKLEEDKKKPQKKKDNHFEAASARRSMKKDNENNKRKPKRVPETFLNNLGSHLELPRAPQRSPRASQETNKSNQKEPSRRLKRSQNHRRIKNVDFSEFVECRS